MTHNLPLLVRICKKTGLPPDKFLYFVSDIFSLAAATSIAFAIRYLYGDFTPYPRTFMILALLFLLSPFIAAVLSLYSSSLMQAPHRLLARIVTYVTVTFSCIFIAFFFAQSGHYYSRFAFIASWFLSCFTVPLGRALVASRFSKYSWWGLPLICMDRSSTGKKIWHYLRSHPEKGLRPVAFMDLPQEMDAATHQQMRELSNRFPGAVAMLAETHSNISSELLAAINTHFSRILVMPVQQKDQGVRQFLATPFVLNATTGFFLQQRLHDRRRILIKRYMDLLLCLLGAVVIIPVFAILALAIKLDSRGAVFYSQKRIGQGGKEIRVHKFRTMVMDADKRLAQYLADNPHLKEEWDRDQKLRDDPRITRVGHFLRRTSLDELPQLYDVLIGTMSLVGPRPIVEAEKKKYGSVFNEYIRVRPGITGLWQISGRNDTTYSERVGYDFFYVSNWSVWFDIWILARTVPVVLFRKGAY